MINMLIGPAIELAGGWFKSKAAQKAAETEAKVAMKKAEAKVYETEATSTMLMEQQLTRQMESSWKDEFWVIIFGSILGRLLPALDTRICEERFHLLGRAHAALVCQLSLHIHQRQLWLPHRQGGARRPNK